ncbi:hypothetical protein RYX36_010661 [Vicia faba]
MNSTKLLFNPEIPETDSLKVCDNIGSPTQPFSYMKDASEMSLEDEFMNLDQCETIEELKDCQDNIVCIVLGIIKHVIGGNYWWYAACVCNKGVVCDSKRFFALSAKNMFGKLCQVDAVVVQDLGSKFDNIAAEEKYGDNGYVSKLIEQDVAESTLVKRGIDEVVNLNDGANSRIMKKLRLRRTDWHVSSFRLFLYQ